MVEVIKPIPYRIKSGVVGGHVTGTADIIDDVKGKTQDVINDEVSSDISNLQQHVDTIEEKIPSEASSSNKLADKAFVDTQVNTEKVRAMEAEQTNAAAVASEVSRAQGAEQVLQGSINSEITRATNAEQVITGNLNQEISRAQSAEGTLQSSINAENTRATGAEGTLQSNIEAEETRAKAAENTIASNLSSEEERAKAAEKQNSDAIILINSKIPSQASDSNQLADKAFVNSSIETSTANFRGTYDTLEELEAVTADNNDYGFVRTIDASGNTLYNRYKYDGTSWLFEYTLNNSSFTAEQWATINSALTTSHKTKLDALPTKSELDSTFDTKQDNITDLDTIRSGAASGSTAYQKPSAGIPSSDMASEVQVSLSKADSAYQKPSTGIPSEDMSSSVNTILGKADTAYQKPSSGIPSSDMTSEVQSSLSKADSSYQKPNGGIPKSDLSNSIQASLDSADSAYQKPSSGIAKSDLASDVQISLGKADTALQEHQSLDNYYTKGDTDALLSAKQETLVSGTNIKTINSQSLLGSGNIVIESGGSISPGNGIDITSGVISVKIGNNLSFDSNGVINASGADSSVENVYIGMGNTYQDVMVSGNLHQTLRKGESVAVNASSTNYLWVILPKTYSVTPLMEGIRIPMISESDVTVDSVVYQVLKSRNTYNGEFGVMLV